MGRDTNLVRLSVCPSVCVRHVRAHTSTTKTDLKTKICTKLFRQK